MFFASRRDFQALMPQQHCALVTVQNDCPLSSICLEKKKENKINWLWCENKTGPTCSWVVIVSVGKHSQAEIAVFAPAEIKLEQ